MAKTRKLEDAGIPQPILAAGPKACAVWNHFMTDESLKPSTNRIYLLAVVQFLRWLAKNNISLNSLTPEHIHAFACRPEAISGRGRNYRTPLRRFLSKLALQGIVSPDLSEQSFPSVIFIEIWRKTFFEFWRTGRLTTPKPPQFRHT